MSGHNHLRVRLALETQTPLQVAAGGLPLGWPDTRCARTAVAGQPCVYLPGAGLKGLLRANAARWLGRARLPGGEQDPVARLFGGRGRKGTLRVPDLLPVDPEGFSLRAAELSGDPAGPWGASPTPEADPAGPTLAEQVLAARANATTLRASAGAVVEVVPPWATFFGEVVLHEVQAWHVGVLALGLEALNRGQARLGGGRARGQGRAHARVLGAEYRQPLRRGNGAACLKGELVAPEVAAAEGLWPETPLPAPLGRRRGLHWVFELDVASTERWLALGLEALDGLRRGAAA